MSGFQDSFVASLLAVSLLFPTVATASQGIDPSPLRIVVLYGEGAINSIRSSNPPPIVEVQDENFHPIPGVGVTFFLPADGPSGVFADNTRVSTVFTDQHGRAACSSIRLNNLIGLMRVRVTATQFAQTATATITQTNVSSEVMKTRAAILPLTAPKPPKLGGGKKKILLGVIAVAGAGAGAYFAFGRKKSVPETTIGVGTPSVGGPN
jgi:hypothetical protein